MKGKTLRVALVLVLAISLVSVALFSNATTVLAVDGAHTSTVTLTPGGSQPLASRNYTLTVASTTADRDAVEQVVIDVPPVGTGGSSFNVTAKTDPDGWTCVSATDQFNTRTDTLTCTPDTLGVATALTEGAGLDWTIAGTLALTTASLTAAINGLDGVSATDNGTDIITITADAFGAGGNDILLATSEPGDVEITTAFGAGVVGAAGVQATATVTLKDATLANYAGDILTVTVPSPARISSNAVKASGVFEVVDGDQSTDYTITVGGNVLTATTDFTLDTVNATTATNLRTAIGALTGFTATGSSTTVIVESDTAGTAGNAIAIASSNTSAVTANGVGSSTLNGGVDSSIDFLFTATAPQLATTYTWRVTTTDVGTDHVLGTGSDDVSVIKSPTTVVDATAPTVASITTKDSDSDGKVDLATVVFDEPVVDSTFAAGDWTIGGVAAESIVTGTPDDATFDISIDIDGNEIDSTAVQDVLYTPGVGTDLAANLLAAVASGDVPEVDGAAPQVNSIATADVDGNGQIDRMVVTLSEAVTSPGSDPAAGWAVSGFTIAVGSSITSNVLTLILTEKSTVDTNATPDTTYASGSGDIVDLAETPLASVNTGAIDEADGASPTVVSIVTKTATTIDITFGEDLDGATADEANFAVASNTVDTAVETAAGIVTLTLATAIDPDALPPVTYTQGTLADFAVKASGTYTVVDFSLIDSTDKVTVNSVDKVAGGTDWTAATSNAATATSLATAISAIAGVSATAEGAVVTVVADVGGTAGNAIDTTTNADSGELTADQATLSGGGGNKVASFGPTAPTDEISPSLLSVTWTDVDGSGAINSGDTLAFLFDEPMDAALITAGNIDTVLPTTTGTGSTYGTTPGLSFNAAKTVLTVTVDTGVDFEAGATINPTAAVKDIAANVDATSGDGPAIVQVTLTLAPDSTVVNKGDVILVSVSISNVDDFDAANYTVTFDEDVLQFDSATAGTIGATTIPVSATNFVSGPGPTSTVTISQNVGGTAGVSGSGALAVLQFTFIGNSGESSTLVLGSVILSNSIANQISANLNDTSVSSTLLLGDADGDGTLSILDITRIELDVAAGLGVFVTPGDVDKATRGANANEDSAINALDITKTELLVAGG